MRVVGRLREWSGVVALILVVAGGTAYAANEWTGANIVNESLTGADVRGSSSVEGTLRGVDVLADSLTGADVDESSLALVPDAAKLGGLGSTRYVRGGAAVPGAFGVSNGKVYFNRVHNTAGGTSTFMEIPGLLHLELDCTAGNGILDIVSDRDGLELFRLWSEEPGAARESLDQGDTIGLASGASNRTHQVQIQAGTGENTFGLQKQVDVTVFWYYTPEGDCLARASALHQQT